MVLKMKEELQFNWYASILESSQKMEVEGKSLLIKGTLLDTSVNANGWSVPQEELENIASQLRAGVQLRLDHSRNVRDVVGGTTDGSVSGNLVLFSAEIDEPDIIRRVIKGRIKGISIGAKAKAFCSACGESIRPVKKCKCENTHILIKEAKVEEISLTPDPAYGSVSSFQPVNFVASLEQALDLQSEKVLEEPKVESLENKEKILEEKIMTDEMKTENANVATIDPEILKALASIGPAVQKLEECSNAIKKKAEMDEEEQKKKESDEAKKAEALKMEEFVRNIVKEEIEKVKKEFEKEKEKPAEEKKEVEEEEEKEPEEEEKASKAKKAETVGASVKGEPKTATEERPGNLYEAMLADIKKASKDFSIVS